MSDNHKDGGPAFPIYPRHIGMTLRDYFAGQALAAMLTTAVGGSADKPDLVREAYMYADAMLEARKT